MAAAALMLAVTAHAQNIDSWTPATLKEHFGSLVNARFKGTQIKTVTFTASRERGFHGPECLGLILDFQRGATDSYEYTSDVDFDDDTAWVDHKTGCTITQYVFSDKPWRFTVTRDGVMVLQAHYIEGVEKRSKAQLVLQIN